MMLWTNVTRRRVAGIYEPHATCTKNVSGHNKSMIVAMTKVIASEGLVSDVRAFRNSWRPGPRLMECHTSWDVAHSKNAEFASLFMNYAEPQGVRDSLGSDLQGSSKMGQH